MGRSFIGAAVVSVLACAPPSNNDANSGLLTDPASSRLSLGMGAGGDSGNEPDIKFMSALVKLTVSGGRPSGASLQRPVTIAWRETFEWQSAGDWAVAYDFPQGMGAFGGSGPSDVVRAEVDFTTGTGSITRRDGTPPPFVPASQLEFVSPVDGSKVPFTVPDRSPVVGSSAPSTSAAVDPEERRKAVVRSRILSPAGSAVALSVLRNRFTVDARGALSVFSGSSGPLVAELTWDHGIGAVTEAVVFRGGVPAFRTLREYADTAGLKVLRIETTIVYGANGVEQYRSSRRYEEVTFSSEKGGR